MSLRQAADELQLIAKGVMGALTSPSA